MIFFLLSDKASSCWFCQGNSFFGGSHHAQSIQPTFGEFSGTQNQYMILNWSWITSSVRSSFLIKVIDRWTDWPWQELDMKLVPARISKAIRRTMRLSKVGVKSLAAWIGADSWMHEMHEKSINRKHKMINNYITHNAVFYFTLNDVSIRVSCG